MEIPSTLQNKVIEFLKSLPNMDDNKNQQAFIYSVGLDLQLQNQISFNGPPAQFVPLLVSILLKYGKLNDGRYALEAVLGTAKDYVGQDRQEYCETLIQEIHATVTGRIQLLPQRGKMTNKFLAVCLAMIFVISGFITIWYFLYVTNSQSMITSTEFRICEIAIEDIEGNLIPEIDGAYSLKPNRPVTINIEIENPKKKEIEMLFLPVSGRIRSNTTYIPPDTPGGEDILTIRVIDENADSIIYQKAIRIKIINNTML